MNHKHQIWNEPALRSRNEREWGSSCYESAFTHPCPQTLTCCFSGKIKHSFPWRSSLRSNLGISLSQKSSVGRSAGCCPPQQHKFRGWCTVKATGSCCFQTFQRTFGVPSNYWLTLSNWMQNSALNRQFVLKKSRGTLKRPHLTCSLLSASQALLIATVSGRRQRFFTNSWKMSLLTWLLNTMNHQSQLILKVPSSPYLAS